MMSMKIIVNGNSETVGDGTTAEMLLQKLELADKKLALEVNEEILPRSEYSDYLLKSGDRIEIIHAIGGG